MIALVYVAGSSKEIERVRVVQKRIQESSFLDPVPGGDWTEFIEAEQAGKPDRTAAQCARADIDAIDRSSLLFAVWPVYSEPSKGLCFEIGYALARKKTIVLWDFELEALKSGFIFAALPGIVVESNLDRAIAFASGWAYAKP